MPNRIGITEAPRAVLGEPGLSQAMPIAEVESGGKISPKSTTIADMADFFGSGAGVVSPQIQRFIGDPNNQTRRILSRDVPIGGLDVLTPWNATADGKEVLAGDEDFYRVAGGGIVASEPGLYRLEVNVIVDYISPVEINNGRWRSINDFLFGPTIHNVSGHEWAWWPSEDGLGIDLGELNYVAALNTSQSFVLDISLQNTGNTQWMSDIDSSYQIVQGRFFQRTFITVTRVAEVQEKEVTRMQESSPHYRPDIYQERMKQRMRAEAG